MHSSLEKCQHKRNPLSQRTKHSNITDEHESRIFNRLYNEVKFTWLRIKLLDRREKDSSRKEKDQSKQKRWSSAHLVRIARPEWRVIDPSIPETVKLSISAISTGSKKRNGKLKKNSAIKTTSIRMNWPSPLKSYSTLYLASVSTKSERQQIEQSVYQHHQKKEWFLPPELSQSKSEGTGLARY